MCFSIYSFNSTFQCNNILICRNGVYGLYVLSFVHVYECDSFQFGESSTFERIIFIMAGLYGKCMKSFHFSALTLIMILCAKCKEQHRLRNLQIKTFAMDLIAILHHFSWNLCYKMKSNEFLNWITNCNARIYKDGRINEGNKLLHCK